MRCRYWHRYMQAQYGSDMGSCILFGSGTSTASLFFTGTRECTGIHQRVVTGLLQYQ